ncbi:TIGR01458 family HAD-type hydrolase, partial [candidate division GN15 bacterium]|nr:TIGR01458 family HAD-type hydrolase [candidate division GN15 bacterium]
MDELNDIKGYLVDLGGVVFVDDQLIDGSAKTIAFLRDQRIPFRFITNTTTHSIQSLLD